MEKYIILAIVLIVIILDIIMINNSRKKISKLLEEAKLTDEQLGSKPGKVINTIGQLYNHLKESSQVYDLDFERHRKVISVEEKYLDGNFKVFIEFEDGKTKLFEPNKFII